MTIKFKGEEDLKDMTFVEKVKFYTSLCLGTTALLSVFAFLFLIPFVVDPSITTIMANFDTKPVVCTTAAHVYTEGLSNCTWTSCKEGCTSATPRCHQIYVNYSEMPFQHFVRNRLRPQHVTWVAGPIRFYINTEGCGYPPRINCTEFAKKYGIDREEAVFPCYYSRRYPYERAVAHFDWNDTVKNLLLAFGVPNVLFVLSVGILSYWYCWPSLYDRRPNMLSTTYATFDTTNESIEKLSKKKSEGQRLPTRRHCYRFPYLLKFMENKITPEEPQDHSQIARAFKIPQDREIFLHDPIKKEKILIFRTDSHVNWSSNSRKYLKIVQPIHELKMGRNEIEGKTSAVLSMEIKKNTLEYFEVG